MTFKVIDKTTGREPTAKVLESLAKKGGLMEMDIDEFYVGEDGQVVLADECGRIAYVDSDRFEVVLIEDSTPDQADRIVNNIGDVKVGGPIGITREMLEGQLNEG